ncbi:MAG: sulfotransferase family 2 domain-containing protein [Rhodobacter sp.]|nr:sulfotransferase family 2 domain-containing protein [Rhodobacter sp.]
MPVYVINGKRILFSHIPKCGGSSIEAALRPMGHEFLFDRRFHNDPDRFSACSAQHLHRAAIARLFPDGAFDYEFAVVRHPVDRAVSEFRFRRDLRPRTRKVTRPARLGPEPEDFDAWVRYMTAGAARHPYLFDNHVRPQAAFIGPETRVFRFEDGLARVFAELSETLGTGIVPPAKRHQVSRHTPVEVDKAARDRLEAFYAADFDTFGYGRAAA